MAMKNRLRDLLDKPGLIVAPGVFDVLSARLVQAHGFPAAYVTGAGASLSLLGQPDLGLITGPELAQHAARIGAAVDLPLIVDADTGYGNTANVRRTVRLYEQAGVSAMHLEDQEFPKRCGHLPNKKVVSIEEHEQRIRAACDSRTGPELLIIARTDARAPLGFDAAIERANRYREAGADVIFVEAPQSREEIERIAQEIDAPLLINMISNSVTPMLTRSELEDLGYRIAIYPIVLLSPAVDAMDNALAALHTDGDDRSVAHLRGPRELFDIVGLDAWNTFVDEHS